MTPQREHVFEIRQNILLCLFFNLYHSMLKDLLNATDYDGKKTTKAREGQKKTDDNN